MKTQILITDIPKCKFEQNWPHFLQAELFNKKDASFTYGNNGNDDVTVFTPLKSLHRIFIMCGSEESALRLYHYLQDLLNINKTAQSSDCSSSMRVYLTNSLLKSSSSQNSISSTHTDSLAGAGAGAGAGTPPVLTVDTEGIDFIKKNKSCNTCSDGSLSPVSMDYSPGGHPVKMKRRDTGEYVYYNEPKPNKSRSNSSLLSITHSNTNLRGLNTSASLLNNNSNGSKSSNPFIVINDAS
ncbi:hypothetical protein ACO0QE_002418 [Hanseniaspora vineae]